MTELARANVDATAWHALSGQYQLRPGTRPGVVGHRPVLDSGRLGRWLRGQHGAQVGQTLSAVFSLCAHAHRDCATLALATAQSGSSAVAVARPAVLLYLETARDHLRSIALDWPQRLPELGSGPGLADWLRGCPLSLASARHDADTEAAWAELAALRTWLEASILQAPSAQWLSQHDDAQALAQWSHARAAHLLPARCLATWEPLAQHLALQARSLDLLDADDTRQTEHLRQIARQLADVADFAQYPTWLGECAENGPWSRLRHRHTQNPRSHNAFTRISARWMELIELAQARPQVAGTASVPLLSSGALALSTGQALAWCEMARGLLLHWVQLDTDGAVHDYRVLAPTEWNFHPDGALAHAVATLSATDSASARTLAAAYDPCVTCTVSAAPTKENQGA